MGTLRRYEEWGLLEPVRAGRRRLYSEADIEQVQRITSSRRGSWNQPCRGRGGSASPATGDRSATRNARSTGSTRSLVPAATQQWPRANQAGERRTMPVTIVMGGQWGDEGKGKLTDVIGGGSRCHHPGQWRRQRRPHRADRPGHIQVPPHPVRHPQPNGLSIVGAGVVVDPKLLIEEMNDLAATRDLTRASPHLGSSPRRDAVSPRPRSPR